MLLAPILLLASAGLLGAELALPMKPESPAMIEDPVAAGPVAIATVEAVAAEASEDNVVPATTPAIVAAMTWIYSGATLSSAGIVAPEPIANSDVQQTLLAEILTLIPSLSSKL